MQLKTYRAPTVGEALVLVKQDLGRDAVIIHTRSFRVGTVLGFGGRTVVEITASLGQPKPVQAGTAPARRARPVPVQAPVDEPPTIDVMTPRMTAPPAAPRPLRAAIEPRVSEFTAPAALPRSEPVAPRVISAKPGLQAVASDDLDAQLQAIKRLVGQVLQCSRQTAQFVSRQHSSNGDNPGRLMLAQGSMPDHLFQHYTTLLENEVAGEIADEVITRVRDELSAKDMSDSLAVRQSVVRHLAAMVPSDPDVARPVRPRDGRPLTVALVGPTGVGKTTTIAKLAATYKLRYGKKIRLITSDTYRIAAVDQLRTYAQIIGVPVDVVLTPGEMLAACQNASQQDVVLIDTAGRSPRDAAKIDDLAKFMDAAKPHHTHLVLAGTASAAAMVEAAHRFAAVRPNRVILSKMDEAVNFGVLIGIARKIDLKLSYFTTGQEVPDHLEIGKPDRLARLALEGQPAGSAA